jgi:hypothetical protein
VHGGGGGRSRSLGAGALRRRRAEEGIGAAVAGARLSSGRGRGEWEGEEAAIIFGFEGFGRAPVGGKSLGCFGFPVSIAAASIWKFVRVLAATLRGGGGSEGKIGEKNFFLKKLGVLARGRKRAAASTRLRRAREFSGAVS